MYLLEVVFVLLALGFLIGQSSPGVPRMYLFGVFAAGASVIMLAVFAGQARWQLAPAFLLFLILSLFLFRRSYSHVAIRSLGIVFGVLLLAISVTLALGMPVLALPAPGGPYVVGSTSFSAVDESRDNAFFGAPGEKREVYVQAWYPGMIEADKSEPRVRTLWAELYRGDRDLFVAFAGYLRGMKTHSYEDLPLSAAQSVYPAIFFSHAIVSFAEQNTLLMEHLASHGYVVFAISHTYTSMRVVSTEGRAIYPALDKINEVSAQFRAVNDEVLRRIERAGSAEERANLHLESYERAGGLNDLAEIWVDDLRFVLDSITSASALHPNVAKFSARIDTDHIGFAGMSFGGGAVTELCKTDIRCRAALNLDGAEYGKRQRQPLRVPYLALIRQDQSTLDFLLPASQGDYYQVRVAGTTHLDFTDDAVVLPILKWMNVNGRIPGARIVDITNRVALRFFDAYLRDGAAPSFDDIPELTVEVNDRARTRSR